MANDEYWKNRAVQEMYEDMAEAEETAEKVAEVYLKASRYIEKQLEGIFDTFRRRHGLSVSQAYLLIRRMKNKSDLEELVRLLQNSIDAGDKEEKERLIAELESAAYRARIEHFARLQSQIDEMMQEIYKQEKTANQKLYESLAQDSYYRSIFDIQQRCGVGFSFNHTDPKQIEHVLSRPWSGKHYSKRIWDNTQALAGQVQEEILLSLMTGKTEREAAESVNAVFAKGSAVARRLIRTESNYVTTELNFKAYEEAGIEEYQYLATLDLKTSEICRSLDGKIFKVSEHQVGVNCPPMHPWCRSTTISVVDRAYISKMKRSAIDPATGEKILVPRSMNYAQWYDKYVEGRKNEQTTKDNSIAKTSSNGIIKLSDDEQHALNKYFSFESYDVNNRLRKSEKLTPEQEKMVADLDNALKKMKRYKGNLSRSLYFGNEAEVEKFMELFSIDKEVVFKEYISTKSTEGLYNPDGEVQMYIRNVKNGRNVSDINRAEAEVIYERGSRFKVLDIVHIDGKYNILLEEINE